MYVILLDDMLNSIAVGVRQVRPFYELLACVLTEDLSDSVLTILATKVITLLNAPGDAVKKLGGVTASLAKLMEAGMVCQLLLKSHRLTSQPTTGFILCLRRASILYYLYMWIIVPCHCVYCAS